MIYASIDLESTGLNPKTCQVLQVGAVIDDTLNPEIPIDQLPSIEFLVQYDQIQGQPYALNLNRKIIENLAFPEKFAGMIVRPHEVSGILDKFFKENNAYTKSDRIIAAGKNFATFDKLFLENLPQWNIRFHQRIIDPCSMWLKAEDELPPDSKTCMERAHISGEVEHTALADAKAVVQMIRMGLEHNRMGFLVVT